MYLNIIKKLKFYYFNRQFYNIAAILRSIEKDIESDIELNNRKFFKILDDGMKSINPKSVDYKIFKIIIRDIKIELINI